jgi:hypothetical protein
VSERIVPSSALSTLDRDLAELGKLANEARKYNQTTAPKQVVDTVTTNIAAGVHTRVLEALQAAGAGDPTRLASALGDIKVSTSTSESAATVTRIVAEHPELVALFQAVSTGSPAESATPAPATARFVADLGDTPQLKPAHVDLKSLLDANPQFDLATGNVATVLGRDPRAAGDSAEAAAFKHRVSNRTEAPSEHRAPRRGRALRGTGCRDG